MYILARSRLNKPSTASVPALPICNPMTFGGIPNKKDLCLKSLSLETIVKQSDFARSQIILSGNPSRPIKLT